MQWYELDCKEVGDMTAAQKAVYTLALTNPKWIRVYVNEQDLSSIKMGDTAQVIRDAYPNQPYEWKNWLYIFSG